MRKIKFRAWVEDLGGYFEEDHIVSREFIDYRENYVLEQYTGLKDNNGVEIYEGDVISYWDGAMIADRYGEHYPNTAPYYFSRTKNKIVDIVYCAPSFKIRDGNPLNSQYLKSDDIEKIGNIHENSELIGE